MVGAEEVEGVLERGAEGKVRGGRERLSKGRVLLGVRMPSRVGSTGWEGVLGRVE